MSKRMVFFFFSIVVVGFWTGEPLMTADSFNKKVFQGCCIGEAGCEMDLTANSPTQNFQLKLDPATDDEPYRPGFHFTSATGTLSDPNGLVYYEGKFHLFFQHNPNNDSIPVPQHWGHAVSHDLIHWQRLPIALYPHKGGDIWSGSAVVDQYNTSLLQKGQHAPIVAFYTWEKNFTQRMAYSNDGGKRWREYAKNPVLTNISSHNRDPKVFWHEETGQWIMVLYAKGFVFFASDNLKTWEYLSTSFLDLHECPDFFELPVDNDEKNKKWVLLDASGTYYVGLFDGKQFFPENGPHFTEWNNRICYATQTWNNLPEEDGRRIQIAAMRDDRQEKIPSENFQNQMTFPVNLTLQNTREGIRLFRYPVSEIEKLYSREVKIENMIVKADQKQILGEGELIDMAIYVKIGDAESFSFNIRGTQIRYDIDSEKIIWEETTVPLDIQDNKLIFRFLIDRSSIELFGNAGRISISRYFLPDRTKKITVESVGGVIEIEKMEFFHLESIWNKKFYE